MSVRNILCWVGNVRLAHNLLLQSFGPPLLTSRTPSPPEGSHAKAPGANPWPWSTVPWAYAGPISIRRQPGAQLVISIQRMGADETLAALPEPSG